MTAVMYASDEGREGCLQLLIETGADLEQGDEVREIRMRLL